MTLQKKQVELFAQTIDIGTGVSGLYIFHTYLNHEGKINHNISGSFNVSQLNPKQIHDIKFYILNEEEFVDWFLIVSNKGSSYLPPPKKTHYVDKTVKHRFLNQVSDSTQAYFIFDNRYSTFSNKQVNFNLIEEWEEETNSIIDVVTTIPPQDKSLNEQVIKIIEESKHSLQIISPYIDMSLINELLTKKTQGIIIQLITRKENEFNNKAKKDAFNYLRSNLKENHITNDSVHSRIIISDKIKILVSSADLTHDSLRAQFNAGIITTETPIVKKLIEYFDIVWRKSNNKND